MTENLVKQYLHESDHWDLVDQVYNLLPREQKYKTVIAVLQSKIECIRMDIANNDIVSADEIEGFQHQIEETLKEIEKDAVK